MPEVVSHFACGRQRRIVLKSKADRILANDNAPDVSVFTDGKVEIMFKLTYEQAENLARSNPRGLFRWFESLRVGRQGQPDAPSLMLWLAHV